MTEAVAVTSTPIHVFPHPHYHRFYTLMVVGTALFDKPPPPRNNPHNAHCNNKLLLFPPPFTSSFRFYTLMVLGTALFDKPPFKNLVCNGLVLAADGKKMSKRLKNYPVSGMAAAAAAAAAGVDSHVQVSLTPSGPVVCVSTPVHGGGICCPPPSASAVGQLPHCALHPLGLGAGWQLM